MILTVPCPIQVDVFQSQDSEPLVVSETVVGQTASLTKAQLMKEYPLMIGYVPGQNVDDTFTQCEDICVIHISGCIPGCVADAQNLLTTVNAVHLHDVGTRFAYKIFVNSSAPGYGDFIDALSTATGATCPATAPYGSQLPAAQDTTGVLLDLVDAGADATGEFSNCTSATGIISNGVVTLYWSVPTPAGTYVNVTDILAAINAVLAGTVVASGATGLDITAPSIFAGTPTIIKVSCGS